MKIKELKPTQEQLDALAENMDDEIREGVHGWYHTDTPEKFLAVYIDRHREFGELIAENYLPLSLLNDDDDDEQ